MKIASTGQGRFLKCAFPKPADDSNIVVGRIIGQDEDQNKLRFEFFDATLSNFPTNHYYGRFLKVLPL